MTKKLNLTKFRLALVLFSGIGWFNSGGQGGATEPWRVEGKPTVVRQEIQFANGDVHFSGTVYFPEHGDHLPGVVALHGAADATRDSGVYRHLRDALPAIGIAVLIYDRRGSGGSSGTLKGVDYETLADDGIAAQSALAKLPRIDAARIGFWGLSQGGWLAVLAAARNQTTTFAMSVSAPLTTPEQQMQFATKNLMNVRGYSPADVNEMLETRKAWTGYLKGANSRDAALNALAKVESRPWFKFAFMPKASQLTTDPTRNSYRKEMDYDPVAPIRQLKIPLLFIFGGADPWVPVATSAPQLRTLAKEQPNIQYAVIPDANHEMMFVEHDTMEFDEKAVQTNGPQAPEISCCWPHGFASNWASEIRKTRFSLARKSASQNSIRVL